MEQLCLKANQRTAGAVLADLELNPHRNRPLLIKLASQPAAAAATALQSFTMSD
jgi:hypothetical protein